MSIDNCVICEGEFIAEKLKDGKCDSCNNRFPGIKNKAELQAQRENKEKVDYNKGSLDALISKKVDEILKDYGLLSECECGKLYVKTSPAKKSCGECKGDK